ncbi:transposase [Holospora curviuscula]|uniref:transposase n=1 Tax=Holospora curviuscula TaxID=1082868 RepID=UPI000CE5ACBA
MDHASFHTSQKTRALIQFVDFKTIFLLLYSPNLNPIETFWTNMKSWITDRITYSLNAYEAITHFFSASSIMEFSI